MRSRPGYISLWLVAKVFRQLTSKEVIGADDLKLGAAVGACLGPFALMALLMIASVGGACACIWFHITHRRLCDGYFHFTIF